MDERLRKRYAAALASVCKRHQIEGGCVACERRLDAIAAVRDEELWRETVASDVLASLLRDEHEENARLSYRVERAEAKLAKLGVPEGT